MTETKPNSRRQKFSFFDATEKPTEWIIRLCGWSSIIGIAAIFGFIFKEAAPMVPKLDWAHFFTSSRWIPNPAPGNAASFGALALLVGTFATTFIALIIAVPVGLGAAVYVSEFAKGKVKETLKVVIELLAAIPSIVWGFIGLIILGPIVQLIFSAPIDPTLARVELVLTALVIAALVAWILALVLPKGMAPQTRRAVVFGLPACLGVAGYFVFRKAAPNLDEFIEGPMSDL